MSFIFSPNLTDVLNVFSTDYNNNYILLNAGTTYRITFKNNGGYFWEGNKGISVVINDRNMGMIQSEVLDFNEGTIEFTPTEDVTYLEIQLLPFPSNFSGTVDFYLSIEVQNQAPQRAKL